MPITAFSTSALNAATPGLSKLAAAIAGGGGAYQQGMNSEIQLQSRLAQALSAQQLNQAKEDEIRDQMGRGTPEAVLRNVMTGFGIPLNDTNAVTKYMETGELGGRFAKPADDVGPVLPEPAWAKNLGRVGQAVMATQNALAVGDKNSANIARATGDFREQGLSDAIIAGQADRNTVAGAQAAAGGKELFNRDSTGSVLDQFTGALETDNPLAQSTINLRNQQAKATAAKPAAGPKAPAGYRFTQSEDGESVLEPIPGGPKDASGTAPPKPMPTSALKMQQEELDTIGSASGIQADLAAFDKQIADRKLNLGVVSNLINQGRNMAGMSTEQSRNLASFKAMLEKLRNDSLRLNKGVQTDGDAQRAWNELITNINDPNVVRQRIAEIRALNDRAVQLRRLNIDTIRSNFGQAPLDVSERTNLPSAVGGAPAGGGWSIQKE